MRGVSNKHCLLTFFIKINILINEFVFCFFMSRIKTMGHFVFTLVFSRGAMVFSVS